ncbi:MAG: peptidoglycan DD-metalloendopeptidase family protein, partial [Bacteroidota bacterium]
MTRLIYFFYSFLCFVILGSCGNENLIYPRKQYQINTPRDAYWAALDSTGLSQTLMVKNWQKAAQLALADSVKIATPFREIGYFQADAPQAIAYQLDLKTGERLDIRLSTQPDSVLFFVDLFRLKPTDSTTYLQHLISAEDYKTDSLAYEAQDDGTYLLRLQPELLATCKFTIELVSQPAYGAFPVEGKDNTDIWSSFGDPRDGGRRTHKGIDIFARRGTPVVAAVDGRIRSVRDTGLGGKQVWLYDQLRRQSLYYAHLDQQLVEKDQIVQAGDTLGTVGNTGNARFTPPHLHFGIYRRGYGAIDPKPFVAYRSKRMPRVNADLGAIGQMARIRLPKVSLRKAPQRRAPVQATLEENLPVEIIAGNKYWYRVRNSIGLTGYLQAGEVESLEQALSIQTTLNAQPLLQHPSEWASPLQEIPKGSSIEVLGIS